MPWESRASSDVGHGFLPEESWPQPVAPVRQRVAGRSRCEPDPPAWRSAAGHLVRKSWCSPNDPPADRCEQRSRCNVSPARCCSAKWRPCTFPDAIHDMGVRSTLEPPFRGQNENEPSTPSASRSGRKNGLTERRIECHHPCYVTRLGRCAVTGSKNLSTARRCGRVTWSGEAETGSGRPTWRGITGSKRRSDVEGRLGDFVPRAARLLKRLRQKGFSPRGPVCFLLTANPPLPSVIRHHPIAIRGPHCMRCLSWLGSCRCWSGHCKRRRSRPRCRICNRKVRNCGSDCRGAPRKALPSINYRP